MKFNENAIHGLIEQIDEIIGSALELEEKYARRISRVHPDFSRSAKNLVHYMALRQYDVKGLQDKLCDLGLTPFHHLEPHVLRSLMITRVILQRLIGEVLPIDDLKSVSVKKSRKLLNNATRQLFGSKSQNRRTRIMVTIPSEVALDDRCPTKLLKVGMNCARINCAHDDKKTWKLMIDNIRSASKKSKRKCRIMMDLSGPKLRTGKMISGPQVLHLKPNRDELGTTLKPAKIWLAPPGVLPQGKPDATIPVSAEWLKKVKRGNVVTFIDSRQKKCSLEVVKKQGHGKWAVCFDSAYITTGTDLSLKNESMDAQLIDTVGELLPLEQSITLKQGDKLVLHENQDRLGEPAKCDPQGRLLEPAHISCTAPEIFDDVKPGEPILFDDGKIEGVITEVREGEIDIKIVNAKDTGSKLKAEKGINLPETELSFSGLTAKDREDIKFVLQNADAVNVSFVNDHKDVRLVIDEFQKHDRQIGLILKIETRKGFHNLPLILLEAMQVKPVGVMIARGDLAVEIGWNDMANVQEEILRVCEAAHIPDIWATQVLENMAKKGIPSRAEITDAGMSQRAECVMLNKGPQITKAIKMLDKILRNMQEISQKQENALPQLKYADQLLL